MVRGRDVVRRVLDTLILAVLSAGCSELIDPQAEAALEYRFPSEGAVALGGGPCSGYVCDVEEEDPATGETVCVCELPGFGTGPPPPPPEPVWPEYPPPPPGWVSDIGGGGYPDGGGSEGCDPTADDPPCFEFEVRLACPAGIVRGRTGRCTVTVPGRSFTVHKWYFRGPTIKNEWSSSSRTWEGILIESGDVRVDIMVNGIPATATNRITVAPRRTGKFTQSAWEAQMTFVKGRGKFGCGEGERPHYGGLTSWSGSLYWQQKGRCIGHVIDPWSETGYVVGQVPSGPNKGGKYLPDVIWLYRSTSQIHPGRERDYRLTNASQADLCRRKMGLPAGSPVSVSFNEFNRVCKEVPGWNRFWDSAWEHERQHWENGRTVLQKPNNNLYIAVEDCVGQTWAQLNDCIIPRHQAISKRFGPVANDIEPAGNWSGQIWVWRTENWFRAINKIH